MKKLIMALLLLSGTVFAGLAGLVVQFDNSTVVKKCVEFQSGASAFDILVNSGLQIVTKDYGAGLGMALCKIVDVGCSADNCFCQSDYWGFYYMSGGSWRYAPVGISMYNVSNGDVLGFRWGAYGDQPELHSFSELCMSAKQGGGAKSIRHFNVSINGNCTDELFVIHVKESVRVIWEPTAFLHVNSEYADVENGVGIRVLLRENYFGRDAGFENVAFLFTDKEGNASFIPDKAGVYILEFEKGEDFLREEREVEVNECKKWIPAVNGSVEKPKQNEEAGQDKTRVDITAPEIAEVDGTVIVRMTSESGKLLANESIVVEFSGGRKELLTNESGEASFNASRGGVYSYSSPGHTLTAYRLTYVVEPAKIVVENPTTPLVQKEEAAPSMGMTLATPLHNTLAVVAGGIVVLALLYALRKARN